ncbi:Outer membrane protein OmpA [Malonomonas rubra DSM 5091]|uniref:Outer membrane protein OmpA n=1 Tax=Malonomonas rubra DSM 5091 TaxID=1122189 RepID=A0A1M6E1S4_MALRU|nr:OmpA family protein [Malonomonas rubra]SHI79320.1 Outer membrane protein OmpA [Malonomonas rubra DSM 5091]
MHKVKLLMSFFVLLATLTACATNTTHENTKKGAGIGALVGAVSGAIIGYQNDHSGGALRGALIGGAAGGAIGAGAGAYMDKQQTEFEQQLANERAQHQIEIERQQNEILKLTMSSEVSFDYDSAVIKSSFYSPLDKIADIMNRYPQTQIVVAGHTDSKGSEEYNLQLSLRRANAVADYLMARNVDRYRLGTEGRGELEPIASNDTAAGRAQNRRVEIFVVPNQTIQ